MSGIMPRRKVIIDRNKPVDMYLTHWKKGNFRKRSAHKQSTGMKTR